MRNIVKDLIGYIKVNLQISKLEAEKSQTPDVFMMAFNPKLDKSEYLQKKLERTIKKQSKIQSKIDELCDESEYLHFCLHHPITTSDIHSLHEFHNFLEDDDKDLELITPESQTDFSLD